MESILEQLWYGNIAPYEKCGGEDEETGMLLKLMRDNETVLRKELQEGQKLLFDQYAKWADRYASCISVQAFREGFVLAAKIFTAVMQME